MFEIIQDATFPHFYSDQADQDNIAPITLVGVVDSYNITALENELKFPTQDSIEEQLNFLYMMKKDYKTDNKSSEMIAAIEYAQKLINDARSLLKELNEKKDSDTVISLNENAFKLIDSLEQEGVFLNFGEKFYIRNIETQDQLNSVVDFLNLKINSWVESSERQNLELQQFLAGGKNKLQEFEENIRKKMDDARQKIISRI